MKEAMTIFAEFLADLGQRLGNYWLADYIYFAAILMVTFCLWRGHRTGQINLWDAVTTTARDGRVRTDARKLYEAGAFVVMTIAFSYLVVQDKLSEGYAAIYVGAFVTAKFLRDREQRLNRQIDVQLKPQGESK